MMMNCSSGPPREQKAHISTVILNSMTWHDIWQGLETFFCWYNLALEVEEKGSKGIGGQKTTK